MSTCPPSNQRLHSDYDSAESIADSDLEDGELRKMLTSPLYIHVGKEKIIVLLTNPQLQGNQKQK